jgi:hypothetical protein
MGTQPENIEKALKGRRTLPQPGEQPEPTQMGGERKRTQGPETQEGADFGEGFEGKEGQKYTKEEEKRFQARGGHRNAASEERP